MLLDSHFLNHGAKFAPAIARCPGRTFEQRRHVLPRLQRVRNSRIPARAIST